MFNQVKSSSKSHQSDLDSKMLTDDRELNDAELMAITGGKGKGLLNEISQQLLQETPKQGKNQKPGKGLGGSDTFGSHPFGGIHF